MAATREHTQEAAHARRLLAKPEIQTLVIAQTIRNELETFHGGGLGPDGDRHGFITDYAMKRLNIAIRHAVYEALQSIAAARKGDDEELFSCNFQVATHPRDGELPGTDALEAAHAEFVAGYQGEAVSPPEPTDEEEAAYARLTPRMLVGEP